MSLFDLVILVVLAGYVWLGFGTGLIQVGGSIIGLIVGAWLAGLWYEGFAGTLMPLVGNNENAANILSFFILFLIISKAIGIVAMIIDRSFRLIAIVPGMKMLNRLGGAVLGLIEGILFLGLVLTFAEPFAAGTVFENPINNSQFVGVLMGSVGWLAPLLPDVVDQFKERVINAG
ncbi:CvpA family protein [Patescibacteria group bacterium]